jgi:hypothetical protein
MTRCTTLPSLFLTLAAPVAALAPSEAQAAAAPADAVQYQISVSIPAGMSSTSGTVATIPVGMRLTVQTTSVYRFGAPGGIDRAGLHAFPCR